MKKVVLDGKRSHGPGQAGEPSSADVAPYGEEIAGGQCLAEGWPGLLERVRQGDQAAVARLVRRFGDSARRLAEAYLADAHQAEDAVQEAFVTALERLDDLQTPAAFPGWFRQIVRTEAHRIARKRVERAGLPGLDRPSPEAAPSARLEREEQRELVRRAMEELPVLDRQAAVLYYFQQCGVREVAEALEVPVGTVKRRLHDARARLRQLLLGCVESMEAAERPRVEARRDRNLPH